MTWTFVVALLDRGDALGEVAGDERRALPGERVGQGAAGDVLGDTVEQAGERDLLWSARPVVGEDLVGPSAEEQGVHAPRLLEQDAAGLLVQQWCLPPAVREAAVAVLVGPSRRLCHPVERHELGHDELAHGVFLLLVAMRPHSDSSRIQDSSRAPASRNAPDCSALDIDGNANSGWPLYIRRDLAGIASPQRAARATRIIASPNGNRGGGGVVGGPTAPRRHPLRPSCSDHAKSTDSCETGSRRRTTLCVRRRRLVGPVGSPASVSRRSPSV